MTRIDTEARIFENQFVGRLQAPEPKMDVLFRTNVGKYEKRGCDLRRCARRVEICTQELEQIKEFYSPLLKRGAESKWPLYDVK